mmetsp:Transcript_6982/g.17839  ORF Transcript_6982/g.17839 Transcript_6982/m.17839 type:complete len:372 (-) Transcript_6982:310-1425(-)
MRSVPRSASASASAATAAAVAAAEPAACAAATAGPGAPELMAAVHPPDPTEGCPSMVYSCRWNSPVSTCSASPWPLRMSHAVSSVCAFMSTLSALPASSTRNTSIRSAMKLTETRWVNLPRPTSAGVMSGSPLAGIMDAAFFSTRKYISNVASSMRDCSLLFCLLSIRPKPSSMSRVRLSSASSSSLSLSALCPKLLRRSFSAFFFCFSTRALRITSRSSLRFLNVCLRLRMSAFFCASSARMPSSKRISKNGASAAGCAWHLPFLTSSATMCSASSVRSPCRSARMAPPMAAATVPAAALSTLPMCGTSALSTSVRKLKCGSPSSSMHRQRSAVAASVPPLPRCLRVLPPLWLRTMVRTNPLYIFSSPAS